MEGKFVRESYSELSELALPNDANGLNTLLGGKIMHLVDIAGALAAARHLAEGGNNPFYAAKLATARFYAEQILPPASALLGPITRGADNLFTIPPEHL